MGERGGESSGRKAAEAGSKKTESQPAPSEFSVPAPRKMESPAPARSAGQDPKRVQQAAEALRRASKTGSPQMPPAEKPEASRPASPGPRPLQTPPPAPEQKTQPLPPPKPPVPDGFIEPIRGSFEDWWAFIKANYRDYYFRLLKLNLSKSVATILFTAVAVLALFAAALMLGGIGMGGMEGALAIPFMALSIIAIIIFVVAYLWIDYTFESAALILTHNRIGGKDFSIIGGVKAAAGKTMAFTLIDSGLRLLVLLPAIILLAVPLLLTVQSQQSAFMGASMAGFFVAYIVFWVYFVISMPLYNFAVQFWRFGFLLEGQGVVDSLKAGLSLLKRKFPETGVFVLLMAALGLLFLIPYALYYAIAYVFLMVVQLIAMFIPVVGFVIYIALSLLFLLSLVFFQTLFELSWRPLHYMFWKRIKG